MAPHSWSDGDYASSEDIDSILVYTRQVDELSRDTSSVRQAPHKDEHDTSSSSEIEIVQPSSRTKATEPSEQYSLRANASAELRSRINDLDAEIQGCHADIEQIQNRIHECMEEKQKLERNLEEVSAIRRNGKQEGMKVDFKGKGKAGLRGGINYLTETFDWTGGLKSRMKSVFGIREFRLCQAGVCNANMDGRDIVCIMPTGGGKSLTYQLPALLMTGCTLVISPLISLMTDQILHLREAGVAAAMLTSASKVTEKKQILQRLHMLADRNIDPSDKEIKLIYVTPERMSRDKSFRSLLQKVDNAGKLSRIVIDEAHCVSQLGHDFRKDYKELHILRKIFPRVPIMALSATCGPQVLKDLISILGLKEVVSGEDAPIQGTVLFSSPLYRKNLHYRVEPKPDSAKDQLEMMKNCILENHLNETGIIYCLSKKDTEAVAGQLEKQSGGRIKTGVYHADIAAAEKERLHEAWRHGIIKVVCATIAFGMGIDKGDVRFVMHHSISKSLEGYYQESGRAGRDGRDSFCILYYRPQDATTLAATSARDKNSEEKLHAVLNFGEELRRCRKVQFAEYFSHSSQLSVSSWSTAETDALDRCGHCDNCKRSDDSVERRDTTLAAWQLLKILQAVRQQGGKLTLGKLAALARGGGKGAYDVTSLKGKRRETETFNLDLGPVSGGPVAMSKSDIEHLIIRLTIQKFFQEEYQQTAYNINVYLAPGPIAARLNHLTHQSILAGRANTKLEFDFLKPMAKSKSRHNKISKHPQENHACAAKPVIPMKRKAQAQPKSDSDGKGGSDGVSLQVEDDEDDDDDDEESFDWSYSLRDELTSRPTKSLRQLKGGERSLQRKKGERSVIGESDHEIMVVSSD